MAGSTKRGSSLLVDTPCVTITRVEVDSRASAEATVKDDTETLFQAPAESKASVEANVKDKAGAFFNAAADREALRGPRGVTALNRAPSAEYLKEERSVCAGYGSKAHKTKRPSEEIPSIRCVKRPEKMPRSKGPQKMPKPRNPKRVPFSVANSLLS